MNERDIKDRLDNYSMTVPEGLKARTFESFQRRQAERRRRLGMASGAFVLSALAVLFFWANEERELKLTSSPERRILLSENQIEIPGFTKISNLKNLDYKTLSPELVSEYIPEEKPGEKEVETEKPVINNTETESEIEPEIEPIFSWEEAIAREEKGRRTERISIKVSGSANSGQSSLQNYAPVGIAGTGAQGYGWADNPRLGIALYNKGEQTREERQHFSPMRIGLAFNYEFYPRWILESGISYKELRSEFREGSQEHYIKSYQRLQYIGLPLKLGFQAISFGDFSAYLNAGAVLEKCMAINHRDLYYIGGTKKASESQRETNGPFQFSLEAGAGMDYKINNWLSIFAEISAGWYFDDGSSLKTIYKDSPLNLGFNLGLRFGL